MNRRMESVNDSAADQDNSMLKPSNGKSLPKQLEKGQVKISSFGPNGANRHLFKRKNPQNKILNEEPLEASINYKQL